LNFYFINDLWTTTTCQQRTLFWGPKGVVVHRYGLTVLYLHTIWKMLDIFLDIFLLRLLWGLCSSVQLIPNIWFYKVHFDLYASVYDKSLKKLFRIGSRNAFFDLKVSLCLTAGGSDRHRQILIIFLLLARTHFNRPFLWATKGGLKSRLYFY